MSFEYLDDRSYYASAPRDLSDLGIIPLVYAVGVGAAAAGTVVSGWLSKDDWDVGSYNDNMFTMYRTILDWDTIGWKKGCWTDSGRRARWKTFMEGFGKHYGAHGKISGISFVSDSEERPAREYMRKLALWGDELNKACGANIPDYLPPPVPPPTEAVDYLKYGAWLVGGILAIQLFSAARGAAPRY
jgi:hypothetical protein